MKQTIFYNFLFSLLWLSHAEAELRGIYVVPTSLELSAVATFEVLIHKPYVGPSTEELSYTFPEVLTGSPPLTINLHRVRNTQNEWESPELYASCRVLSDVFECDISFKRFFDRRGPSLPLTTVIDRSSALAYLSKTAVSETHFKQISDVIDSMLYSEPAGVVRYNFEDAALDPEWP